MLPMSKYYECITEGFKHRVERQGPPVEHFNFFGPPAKAELRNR